MKVGILDKSDIDVSLHRIDEHNLEAYQYENKYSKGMN
jgi:hypothetical protein